MRTDNDSTATENGVTQAEVYDNLKRIGELEDEKQRIQEEIWNRTEQLRGVVKHIDRGSILFKILDSALWARPQLVEKRHQRRPHPTCLRSL